MKELCYLNGRIVPIVEARIDPQDRGFLFGDSLYEVVKVVDGIALHLEPHLGRLAQGLERIEIPYPEDLADACRRLLSECSLDTGYLYLQVTRGVAPRSHLPPRDLQPTVLVMPYLFDYPAPAARRSRVVTVPDWRWEFRHLKTSSLMATVVAKLRAHRAEADEVLFCSSAGEIREGGSTNFFVVNDGVLETHPADGSILEGVTRRLVIELAEKDQLEVDETAPQLSEFAKWQEAFLSGTLTGIQPVVEIDDHPIGAGAVGPVTSQLAQLLDRLESDLLRRC